MATGCRIPSSSGWDKVSAETRLEASVSRVISLAGSKWQRTGAVVKADLSVSKACCWGSPHSNLWSFLVRRVRGLMMWEKSLINRR